MILSLHHNNNKELAATAQYGKNKMETFNTTAKNLISKSSAKKLFDTLSWIETGGNPNNLGRELCKMIVENSNDFTKDIAQKWISVYDIDDKNIYNTDGSDAEYVPGLSDKQIWCMVYQLINNENVYKL